MEDLIKDGSEATSRDFYLEMARRKMDHGSDVIVNVMSGHSIYGRILSVGFTNFMVKTKEGVKSIAIDDILDMN